jgi:putative membrane protein
MTFIFGKKLPLTEADQREIELAVGEQERSTCGEIVPVYLSQARTYRFAQTQMTLLSIFLALVGLLIYDQVQFFPVQLEQAIGVSLTGAIIGAVLGFIPSIRRRWVGQEELHRTVFDKACALMLSLGVTRTQTRSGVLILVSFFERRVVILADQGIYQKLPQAEWDSLSHEFSLSLKYLPAKQAFIEVITKVGQILKVHFPRDSQDANELSDRVQFPQGRG